MAASRASTRPGDVLLIPCTARAFAVARVLYRSRRYRGVILLALHPQRIIGAAMPALPLAPKPTLVYTVDACFKTGRWPRVGTIPLVQREEGLAYRIVAGAVYRDDEMLRVATNRDYGRLPRMEVYMPRLLEATAKRLTARRPVATVRGRRTTSCS